MPSRLGPAFRRAKNTWAAIVVVIAGMISALAAVANLTHWVSIAAAVAAVLGGARVLIGELVIPLRMDAVDEATVMISTWSAAVDVQYTKTHDVSSTFGYGVKVGNAFHVGGGRWITSTNVVKARIANESETGAVWLGLGGTAVTGQVTYRSPDLGLAIVQVTQTIKRWPRRVRLAKDQPRSGDRVKIVGWSLPHGIGEARRFSVELLAQGVLSSGAVLLTGPPLPVEFLGAPAIDNRTGRVLGLVRSKSGGASDSLNEAHVVPVSALLTEEATAWPAGVL